MKNSYGVSAEARILMDMLYTVINSEKLPRLPSVIHWENVYKLAAYHRVSNALYGTLIAVRSKNLDRHIIKYYEDYRRTINTNDIYRSAEKTVFAAFDEKKIKYAKLGESILPMLYKIGEHRRSDTVYILVKSGSWDYMDMLMQSMGFERRYDKEFYNIKTIDEKEKKEKKEYWYYKGAGVYVVLTDRIIFENSRKLTRYFAPEFFFRNQKKESEGWYKEDETKLYIYYMALLAYRFSMAEMDLRDLVDLWKLYTSLYSSIDWERAVSEFEKLEMEDFATYIVKLAASWFSDHNFPEEEILGAMGRHIVAKGAKSAEDKEICNAISLSLDEQIIIIKPKIRKEKSKFRKSLEMWFPDREYMEGIYPKLSSKRYRLPYYWLCRIASNSVRRLKNTPIYRLVRDGIKMTGLFIVKVYRKIGNILSALHEKVVVRIDILKAQIEDISEKISKRRENLKKRKK